MDALQVAVQPSVGVCTGFTGPDGRRRRRSVVLVPVKIRVKGGEHTLSWTCNLAEHCHNGDCFYARARAEKPGVQGF